MRAHSASDSPETPADATPDATPGATVNVPGADQDATSGRGQPGSAGRRLMVVHNPVAGWRRQGYLWRVLTALEAQGCRIELRRTEGPGDAGSFAADAAHVDVVVAAGGDGTVNEVLNGLGGLPGGGPALAVIPMGTANVLAHELGLPHAPEALARTLAHGPAVPVTLGLANGRRFVQMAGVGFDAHVVASVRSAVKRRLGKAAYVLAALEVAAGFRHPLYRVEIDGTAHEAASVVICNGHYYAGTYVLAPEARPWHDGLQVCLFRRSGLLQPLRYAAAMQLGRLQRLPDFEVLPARTLRIDGPAGDPVQGDGDLLSRLPLELSVAEQAARFIMPAAP
jgi:YegS/Rv2252/BmrU family lipid kinase